MRPVLGWLVAVLAVASVAGIAIGYLAPARSDAVAAREARAIEVADGGAAPTDPQAIANTAAPLKPLPTDLPQSRPQQGSSRRYTPIVAAVSGVIPSVVSVNVLRREEVRGTSLFEQFFVPRGYERTVKGLGSGIAIDDDGHVLTNQHVVHNALEIVVADAQGRTYPAELVGEDILSDVALIKIEPGAVPPAPLGTSTDLMVGEPAIAIGNPFGYLLANSEATVTTGVISGVGRNILPEDPQERLYGDMIQTDASINPGNSGGPLLNADGQVVGINSSIFSRSGGSEGLGFAIPIDRAMRIARELIAYGRIRRPWLGLDVTESDSTRGPVVRRVAPNSPAAGAGLRANDIITRLDDELIDGAVDWTVALYDTEVGAEVALAYLRGGSPRTARLRVAEIPSAGAERIEALAGLELITLTAEIAIERGVPIEHGALIVRIDSRARAATGLRERDVILAINRSEVSDAAQVAELVRYYSGGRIVVTFYREGRTGASAFVIG